MSSFADLLAANYQAQTFDDPDYRKAEATVTYTGGTTYAVTRFETGVDRLEMYVDGFNAGRPEQVDFTTNTYFGPDIRSVDRAFQDVMGTSCPEIAIGGGTDAKGNRQLIAAGALFTQKLGPPINFHGISDGSARGRSAGQRQDPLSTHVERAQRIVHATERRADLAAPR